MVYITSLYIHVYVRTYILTNTDVCEQKYINRTQFLTIGPKNVHFCLIIFELMFLYIVLSERCCLIISMKQYRPFFCNFLFMVFIDAGKHQAWKVLQTFLWEGNIYVVQKVRKVYSNNFGCLSKILVKLYSAYAEKTHVKVVAWVKTRKSCKPQDHLDSLSFSKPCLNVLFIEGYGSSAKRKNSVLSLREDIIYIRFAFKQVVTYLFRTENLVALCAL